MTPPPVALSRPDDPTLRKAPLLLHAKGRDLVPPKSQFKVEPEVGPSVERKNKDAVKGIVVRSIPTHPLPQRRPEYKEVFNWIHRHSWCMFRYACRYEIEISADRRRGPI
ncbi:uncharacterized protein ARMOST_09907 [Armillaria ostoyae]|uniref:Uncharacterized protein n=1 Tax=Armillaria ostoyae TaxID=47428 RepID=A0A284RCV6_ARMOS|nr:uncharacterized protein ARMOST_09907 [Armillaria ostoyae]